MRQDFNSDEEFHQGVAMVRERRKERRKEGRKEGRIRK
jgi:hypothetical protein